MYARLLLVPLTLGCSQSFDPSTTDDPEKTDDTGVTTDTTDSEVTEDVSLSFRSPGEESTNPITLSVDVVGTVRRVEYFVGDLPVGESVESGNHFAVDYRSDVLGPVTFTARGFDGVGTEVASATHPTRITDLGGENLLGVWIDEREDTGSTHEELAARLGALGVKRVYVKVGLGTTSCSMWPDACDPAVPAAYHARGIEAWGWSTPEPDTPGGGAVGITYTSEAGYDGYVVVLGPDWNDNGAELEATLQVYAETVDENIRVGRAPSTYALHASPAASALEEGLRLDLVDTWTDAVLPLLLAEQLGAEATDDPAAAMATVVCAWRDAGVGIPVHPVLGTLDGLLTPLAVNDFIAGGGAQSSLWRIPDAKDPNGIWDTWSAVDWTVSGLSNSAECR